jgi:hypothetical protein
MRVSISVSLFLLQIASTTTTGGAFSITQFTDRATSSVVLRSSDGDDKDTTSELFTTTTTIHRRKALSKGFSAIALAAATAQFSSQHANALVKGVAPPPKKSVGDNRPKCTNVEECQAMADKRSDEERAKEESGPPPLVTKTGIKYRDLEAGVITLDADGNDISLTAKDGDDVNVYFKVLKLGKRSYDGLSGEGTVVFSRGYGLEDDETKAGQKAFQTTIGGFNNIAALNEALVGMKPDGLRRFVIMPQKGWEKETAVCDGGPGGRGSGGDIKTDYVVVPTATMVQQEACFDNNKLPFPSTYAEQRRMAQRFDQSLIMEVQLVSINNRKS